MRIKKIVVSAVAIATLSLPMSGQARILDTDLSKLFMSNTTGAGSFTNQQRTGVLGGNISLRTPIKSVNIISFDPPRFNAGCGGIDLSMGSFSFISGDQLTAVFRQIGANAAPLLFKAVIKGVSPQLDALITEFQALLQNMNNLAKNTCSLAKMIVDPVEKGFAEALGGEGAIGGSAKAGGPFSDVMGTATNFLKSANETFTKNAPYAPKLGNGVMKALASSGATAILGLTGMSDGGDTYGPQDPNNLNNRVIISMLGYVIAGVPCTTRNSDGTVDTVGGNKGDGAKAECVGRPLIDLDSFLVGGGTGSSKPDATFRLYKCNDPKPLTNADGTDGQMCTDMQVTDVPYQGVRGWTNTMLFGSPDGSNISSDSIVGKFNAGAGSSLGMTAQQQKFINAAGGNLMGILSRISNANERVGVAEKMAEPITNCIMAELGRALYSAANGIQQGNSYHIGPDAKKNIEKIQEERERYKDKCSKDRTFAETVASLINATRMNVSNK